MYLLLTCSTGMPFLRAISSTVSLPSEMIPTLAAIAFAVIGWSPVTIITWIFKTQWRTENVLQTPRLVPISIEKMNDVKVFLAGILNSLWYRQYDISSLRRAQWLLGGQSLRWDLRSTVLMWGNSSHRCQSDSHGEILSHWDRCDRNLERKKGTGQTFRFYLDLSLN